MTHAIDISCWFRFIATNAARRARHLRGERPSKTEWALTIEHRHRPSAAGRAGALTSLTYDGYRTDGLRHRPGIGDSSWRSCAYSLNYSLFEANYAIPSS